MDNNAEIPEKDRMRVINATQQCANRMINILNNHKSKLTFSGKEEILFITLVMTSVMSQTAMAVFNIDDGEAIGDMDLWIKQLANFTSQRIHQKILEAQDKSS